MEKSRYGYFVADRTFYEDKNIMRQVMQHFTVISVETFHALRGRKSFYGVSSMFEEIREEEIAPQYYAEVKSINGYTLFVGFKKVEE